MKGSTRGTPAHPVWQLWPAAAGGCSSEHRPPAVAEGICQLIAEAHVGRGHAPVVVCACRAPQSGAQVRSGWARRSMGGGSSGFGCRREGRASSTIGAGLRHLRRHRPPGGACSWGRRGNRVGGVGPLAWSQSPHERQPDRLATPVGVGLAVDVLITVADSFAVGRRTITREWAPAHPGLVLWVSIPTAHRWRR